MNKSIRRVGGAVIVLILVLVAQLTYLLITKPAGSRNKGRSAAPAHLVARHAECRQAGADGALKMLRA